MTDGERADCHERGLAIARIGEGRWPETLRRCAVLGFPAAPGLAACERRVLRGAHGKDMPGSAVSAGIDPLSGKADRDRDRWLQPGAAAAVIPDAYQRSRLVPDPVCFVEERAEWQAMVLALASLAADLDGRLVAHTVEGPALSLWPWEACENGDAGPRVIEVENLRRFALTGRQWGLTCGWMIRWIPSTDEKVSG